jgi:inorganic pyrophosphatase
MTRSTAIGALGMVLALCATAAPLYAEPLAASDAVLEAPDPYTLIGARNFLTGYPAQLPNGSVHVVVEIPAGSTAKWEVDKSDGALRWEFKKGKPRIVEYLGYPGNYGMVPRTLLPKEQGGDGDPLDVIVLGPAAERGAVVETRIVGVLRLMDDGEQDDKLLAVMSGTALSDVSDLDELERRFAGTTSIVETWFANYKGPGRMQPKGFGDAAEAQKILAAAMKAFEESGAAPLTAAAD